MTLQSSGAIAASDINEELGFTAGATLTIGGAQPRWLAGVSAGAISLSDFYDKRSVKIVHSVAELASGGGSHTFTGVDFGAEYTGRVLVACVCLQAGTPQILDQTSCTIGGVSATGDDAGESIASDDACGAGVWAAESVSGTSGSVTVNWTSGTPTFAGLVLLSVSEISATAHDNTASWQGGGGGGSGSSGTVNLDIPANGVLIVSFAHRGGGNTTLSGVTEQTEITVGATQFTVGFDNRMSLETNRSLSATWVHSGAPDAYGGEGRSYTQGS